jgi:[ribosomal protein S18]-alanine N-acetyltransferase
MNLQVSLYRSEKELNELVPVSEVVAFLYHHLDQYGDDKKDIEKCLNYVFNPNRGGLILLAHEDRKLVGVCIINDTGMSGFIPEHILVYIAVDRNIRGKGIGKKLMKAAIENTPGNIALHVEPDNPARVLYEKLGFTSKYLEMRLHKTAK